MKKTESEDNTNGGHSNQVSVILFHKQLLSFMTKLSRTHTLKRQSATSVSLETQAANNSKPVLTESLSSCLTSPRRSPKRSEFSW